MSKNTEQMVSELKGLNYQTSPFTAPEEQGGADGVQFSYSIKDGSRTGETVTMAVAVHEDEGQWPEVAPHWLYLSPPDEVLAEQVKGAPTPGAVQNFKCDEGLQWMAISSPPSDFWDQIDKQGEKNMDTYLERHVRRIWRTR